MKAMSATQERPYWRGVHHLALITTDMDKTVRFYHGVLGARLVITIATPSFRHYFFEFDQGNPGTGRLDEAHQALVQDRDRQRQHGGQDHDPGADHDRLRGASRTPAARAWARPRAMRYDFPAPMTSTASPARRCSAT